MILNRFHGSGMRFGIGVDTGHTLEDAGRQFSVTRERIRQDRGEGAEEAEASEPVKEAAFISTQLTKAVRRELRHRRRIVRLEFRERCADSALHTCSYR